MIFKSYVIAFFAVVAAVFAGALTVGLLLADHSGTGQTITPVLITNETGADVTQIALPFELSSQTLIDQQFMDADGLDSSVDEAGSAIKYMPGTGQVQLLSCFDNGGTGDTTDCNDAGANDFTLPVTASEVFEFAGDSQFKHLWVNVGTAAVATWSVKWQYYDGSTYQDFANVTDGTSGFTVAGTNRVTWDFPAASSWPQSTLHAVNGYWVRAQVDTVTTITQNPLGTQAWYETGRWWVVEDDIEDNQQLTYDVGLDLSSATVTVTFDIADTFDDAHVTAFGVSWPPAVQTTDEIATARQIVKEVDSGTFANDQVLIRFDTSSIPDDAGVTSATLRCYVTRVFDDDARNATWEWYNWENIDTGHHEDDAQSNAHSVDISTLPTGELYDFELNNLYHIDKAGFTGLRAGISGGQPPGRNIWSTHMVGSVNGACKLIVTYDTVKNYHYYVSHPDGFTLTDAAALEPGTQWHLKVAGYIDTTAGASKYIVEKNIGNPGFEFTLGISSSTDGRVELVNNGSTLFGNNVTSGYHVIEATQGGVSGSDVRRLLIDGVEVDSGSVQTMADNADDWTINQNQAALALEYLDYEVNESTQYTWRITDLPDHQLDDKSGNGNNVATRYPDTIASYTSTVLATAPAVSDETSDAIPAPAILGEVGNTSFTSAATGSASGFFLFDIIDDSATDTGLPFQMIIGLFSIVGVVGVGIVAAAVFGNILMIYFAILVALVIGWQMGVLPLWMAFIFGLFGVFFVVWRTVRA